MPKVYLEDVKHKTGESEQISTVPRCEVFWMKCPVNTHDLVNCLTAAWNTAK